MKKCIFILGLALILLTSCAYESDSEVSVRLGEQLIEYINNRDEDGIKSMFSIQSQKSSTLDSEISGIFNILPNDIVSYGRITCNSGESFDNGKMARRQITVFIDDIKLSDDTVYNIIFYDLNIYEKNSDYIGISEIDIYTGDYESDNCYKVGEYFRAT